MNKPALYPTSSAIAQPQSHFKNDDLAFNPALAIFFILLHIPLGLIVSANSFLATLHALGVLFIGILWALKSQKIERLTYVIAYITGAEVLWRMTSAGVFYEFGKYAVSFISLISILVLLLKRTGLRSSWLIALYFVLLMPSVLITLLNFPPGDARDKISFNLSGPLALFFCVLLFSNIKISMAQFKNILIAFLAPAVAMAVVAASRVLLTTSFRFSGQSSFLLSATVSPNQISSLLGLGMCFAFIFLLVDSSRHFLLRWLLMGLIFGFIVLSALTFSRGGLYLAGASLLVFVVLYSRKQRRFQTIWLISGIALVSQFMLFPFLENYTNGAFLTRFQDLSLSSRDIIGRTDLQIWLNNPVFGAGPGGAVVYRRELISLGASAHTEYTRALAEHGVFGLVSMVLLFVYIGHVLKSHNHSPYRGIAWASVIWFLLYIFINDMRLVAPAFMMGMAALKIPDSVEQEG